MGTIRLNWNNINVTGVLGLLVRASKRIKAIGGAWDTSNFTPANDMANTVNETDADVVNNKVYQFKLESICSGGGITPNLNGIQENIYFACTGAVHSQTHNTVLITVTTTNCDWSKIRVTIRLTADDSLIDSEDVVVPVGAGSVAAYFSGLTPLTSYYYEVEMFASVNAGEVNSSGGAYLGDPCFSTEFTMAAAPADQEILGGVGNSVAEACANITTYYINVAYIDIDDGIQVYADAGLTIPFTGFAYIKARNGKVYHMSSGTGVVEELAIGTCGGEFRIVNDHTSGNPLTAITPNYYFYVTTGTIPISGGAADVVGGHGNIVGTALSFDVSLTVASTVTLYKNGAPVSVKSAPVTDTYTFDDEVDFTSNDDLLIRIAAT